MGLRESIPDLKEQHNQVRHWLRTPGQKRGRAARVLSLLNSNLFGQVQDTSTLQVLLMLSGLGGDKSENEGGF